MSKAFKCDRCKNCFDPFSVIEPDYFITVREFICQDGAEWDKNEVGYREEDVHLCPECVEKLIRFWDGDDKAETEQKKEDLGWAYKEGMRDGISLIKKIRKTRNGIGITIDVGKVAEELLAEKEGEKE